VAEKYNAGYNVLHTAASRVAALDIGFVSDNLNVEHMEVVYLLGVDDRETLDRIDPKAFVIYQGHHGDAGAMRADVILPGAAYTEKNGLYVNTEGRVQAAKQAVWAPGEAREDWKIIRALSGYLGRALPYDDLAQLRTRIVKQWPHFGQVDTIVPAEWNKFGGAGRVESHAFKSPVDNFYITNVITRASLTMAKCAETAAQNIARHLEAAE
jgi:NADH-quinone oxidoreductase subunit G